MSEPSETGTGGSRLLERFRDSWFPPAAVVGAFGAFVAAVFRTRPEPPQRPAAAPAAKDPFAILQPAAYASPPGGFAREYSCAAVVGGTASPSPFRKSLIDVAVGAGDAVFALGDGEVRIFDPSGALARGWKAPEAAACIATGPGDRVYVGAGDRVEVFDAAGRRTGGFAVAGSTRPAVITAVRVSGKEVLVADASARVIRRCSSDGQALGDIGSRAKAGAFILPNRWLDFDVDARGTIVAGDTGRHQVTLWAPDGSPRGSFGRFGMTNPENFVGCCNPVNVAFAPDGCIVTAEKMVARVKVFEPGGKLLAVIGPQNFDPACTSIQLAVDSKGRIITADPVRREVKVFAPVAKKQ
jgi:hypothetical protein